MPKFGSILDVLQEVHEQISQYIQTMGYYPVVINLHLASHEKTWKKFMGITE